MSSDDPSKRLEENLDITDSTKIRLIRGPETYQRTAQGQGFRQETTEKLRLFLQEFG